MKTMRKLAGLLLALVMLFAVATTAFAETNNNKTTITINPPAGGDPDNEYIYTVYKVFDAVPAAEGDNVSYRLLSGKDTAPAGFTADANGYVTYGGGDNVTELTTADIAAIAAYVKDDSPVAELRTSGANAVTFEITEPGYFYITTSTGSVVAIKTLGKDVTVQDKATIPGIEKVITGASDVTNGSAESAMAELGSTVTYKVTITVGNGAKNYKFHDTMDSRLSYNGDAVVTGITDDNYTIQPTPDSGDTFTISFADGLAKDTEITITYSATITGQALSTNSADNTAYVSFGENHKTTSDSTSVYNAQLTVNKIDGNKAPLGGAGFVVKRVVSNGENTTTEYYQLNGTDVSWVTDIDQATEHVSDADGRVAPFIGLANGTYALEEKTVPAGYNKAEDEAFTIAEHDYTAANLEKNIEVTNNAGTQLPSTGGTGTKLFYAVGGILVVGAIVLLVTKKRMTSK